MVRRLSLGYATFKPCPAVVAPRCRGVTVSGVRFLGDSTTILVAVILPYTDCGVRGAECGGAEWERGDGGWRYADIHRESTG